VSGGFTLPHQNSHHSGARQVAQVVRHETLPVLLVPAGVVRAGVALPALRTEMASGMTLTGGGESFIHNNPKKFRTGRDPTRGGLIAVASWRFTQPPNPGRRGRLRPSSRFLIRSHSGSIPEDESPSEFHGATTRGSLGS
jgi:hypothetical protein